MRACLARWGFDESGPDLYDALLVANELLANGVRACVDSLSVEVSGHRDHLEISVADDGSGRAALVDRGAAAESGRGLWIIDSLCDEWGQSPPDGSGKRVWCRLPIDSAPSPISDACTRN